MQQTLFGYAMTVMPMNSWANISECKKYRYELFRGWDITKPAIMFIMLNPSKADATENDPTIRRCINFAKSWGYGGLFVCNLFAYRATNPSELLNTVDNPESEANILYLKKTIALADKVICAWGNSPIIKKKHIPENIGKLIFANTHKCYHLGLSNNGTPKHPLYLKSTTTPIPF